MNERLKHALRSLALVGATALAAGPAWAQGFGATDYPFYTAPQLSFAAVNSANLSVLNQVRGDSAAKGTSAAPASTVAPPSATPLHTAESLARAYAPQQPGAMASVFKQSLDLFAKAAQKIQQPADDVAVALAFFVAANYAAANSQPLLADGDFPRLATQLRANLGNSPDFQKADAKTKRETFEQLAMVGMFVYMAKLELDKNPASEPARHFRDHARANLVSVLGASASRTTLTQGQLVLR